MSKNSTDRTSWHIFCPISWRFPGAEFVFQHPTGIPCLANPLICWWWGMVVFVQRSRSRHLVARVGLIGAKKVLGPPLRGLANSAVLGSLSMPGLPSMLGQTLVKGLRLSGVVARGVVGQCWGLRGGVFRLGPIRNRGGCGQGVDVVASGGSGGSSAGWCR